MTTRDSLQSPPSTSGLPAESRPGETVGRFRALPPRGIAPQRWLKRWAEINAGGWLLLYARNQEPGVYDKFWNRNQTAKVTFSENNETLILCDYTAYFGDGLVHYAQLCPDSELAQEADPWVQKMLDSQDPDGYLGAFVDSARWQHWLEIFSQSLTLEALLYHYEATGDAGLLQACEHAIQPQIKAWYRSDKTVNHAIFSGHGTIAIRALVKLYELTGNVAYLSFARDIMQKYGRVQEFLQPGNAIFGQHDAVGTEHVGLPAMLYEYTGGPELLEASRAAWDMLNEHHLSVDGTPHGNEAMQFKGPLHNCEHCGTVEWFMTSNAMARVTGEVKYADAAERAMLNAYPAAKSVDGTMVAYMHTPNQLVATEWSQPHAWTSPDWCASRQHYHTAHEPLCCNSNGPRGIPYFAESMVMGTREGLAVVYYGPCTASANVSGVGQVTLQMDTDYPFEDEIRITVTPEQKAEFAVQLRIPEWCSSATLLVNGDPQAAPAEPSTYARLRRKWAPGDQILLRFECPIRLDIWKRSEFGVRAAGIAVQRGPLTYTLPVQELWQQFDVPAQGPGKDPVCYRVLPAEGTAWNYALVIDRQHPETCITPVRLPVPPESRPWEHPPLGLQARARRVLSWHIEGDPDHPKTPGLPYNPMKLSDQEETVTLVPFGFTHLRMTYLPFVEP